MAWQIYFPKPQFRSIIPCEVLLYIEVTFSFLIATFVLSDFVYFLCLQHQDR